MSFVLGSQCEHLINVELLIEQTNKHIHDEMNLTRFQKCNC